MELRPYQVEVIDNIFREWEHHDSVMLQMPTGTGKTFVFCEVIKRHRLLSPNKRILVLTHKRELVIQTDKSLKKFSIVPGIIMAGEESIPDQQIQLATVQTLILRRDKLTFLRNISLIVIDEAHHTPSETYRKLLDYYKSENTKVLGVTATPRRTDGQGFSDIFEVLVQSWSIEEFIKEGHLADVEHRKTATYNDLKDQLKNIPIDIKTNDFDEVRLEKLMSGDAYMADAVESYFRYRESYKKSIVFAVNIQHSKQLAGRFNAKGVKAVHIDGKTIKADRKVILDDFRNGLISVLCNVGIVTEGFDCPDAEIVQLVRPTKSITLYLQQVGRVLRPKKDGRHALILDSACCFDEFGSVKSDRRWTLKPPDVSIPVKEPELNPEMESPPKKPEEKDTGMIQVGEPEPPKPYCPLDSVWFEKLPCEIRDFFYRRFAYAKRSEEELLRDIWKLNEINLSGIIITSIRGLDKLTNIQNLNISNTNCESLRPIVDLNGLKILNISFCKANILRLPDNKETLSKLNISGSSFTDIKQVENYSHLTEVIASKTKFKSYSPFSKLSKLVTFLGNHSEFNSLKDLWGAKDSLRVLELCNSNLDSLNLIRHFRRIAYLDISFTMVSSLEGVEFCRSLTTIVIRGVIIKDRSLSELRDKRPDISIEMR